MNFKDKVYEIVKKVPKGKVITYGEVAQALDKPWWSRQVGWALHQNQSSDVPCHRVVDRNGRLAPNFAGPLKPWRSGAFNGAGEQKRRLEAEGVEFMDQMHVDLELCLWRS